MALFADESLQNPYPLYRRMLDHGPVHPPVGDSGFFAVCSWDAVNDAVARPEDFSSNLTGTMTYHPPDGTVGLFFPMDELGGPTQVLAIADDPAHAYIARNSFPPSWPPSASARWNRSSPRPPLLCGGTKYRTTASSG